MEHHKLPFILNSNYPPNNHTVTECHSGNLPLHDFRCCKLTTRVYPLAIDETANENSAKRLFSTEK